MKITTWILAYKARVLLPFLLLYCEEGNADVANVTPFFSRPAKKENVD